MDYVLIAAIMTFFILLYVLNIREGYTDSYVNKTIESISKAKDNVVKTLENIKDLTGTNTNAKTNSIDILDSLEQIQAGLDSESYKKLDGVPLNAITREKESLVNIQNNVIKIKEKIKELLYSANVTVFPLYEENPSTIPLLTAINNITNDLNIVSNNLNKIPNK